MSERICSLRFDGIDRQLLRKKLRDIGRTAGSTSCQEKAR